MRTLISRVAKWHERITPDLSTFNQKLYCGIGLIRIPGHVSAGVRIAELVFYRNRTEDSGVVVPWAKEDSELVWIGIFIHDLDALITVVPALAFKLLPPDGKVLLWAEAYIPGEHHEAAEWLKSQNISYSEKSRVFWKEKARIFRRNREHEVVPSLMARLESTESLEKLSGMYDSWHLGSTDLLILGCSCTHLEKCEPLLEELATVGGHSISRQLLETATYLIITAQEHGAYLLTRKISREVLETVCRNILAYRGFQVLTKESS